MTDMRRERLMQGANGDHTIWTLSVRVAHCPPPPVARKLSYPSWKVIVSASRGQYLKPGSQEPGFFCGEDARSARHCEERSDEAIQLLLDCLWIASRSLSSGAHSRDPLARNDVA